MTATIDDVLAGRARWCVVEGDNAPVLAAMADGCVDSLVTDPPYGVNLGAGDKRKGGHGLHKRAYASCDDSYETFVSEVVPRISDALRVCKRGLVWSGPHIHEQPKPVAIGGVYCPGGAGRHSWGFKQFLPVLLYGKHPSLHLGASVPTAFQSAESPGEEGAATGHPTPKPVGWMLWSVRLASLEDHVVLDPFCGSGTTGVAALRLGRRFIGIERDQKYAAVARERLAAESQGLTLRQARAGQTTLFGGGS